MLEIRWLGHSCIEIFGEKHIVIDPDYVIEPRSRINYICITHGHIDHMGKILNLTSGKIIASKTICNLLSTFIDSKRLIKVEPPGKIENIEILRGSSITNESGGVGVFLENFVRPLIKRNLFHGQLKIEGGQPLAFIIDEGFKIFHDGDGLWRRVPLHSSIDIYCMPCFPLIYEKMLKIIQIMRPRYIIPIHHDVRLGKGANIKKFEKMLSNENNYSKLLMLQRGKIYTIS